MWHCDHLHTIDSTQHEAIRRIDGAVSPAADGRNGPCLEPAPFVLWTTAQTQGVGRHGRPWWDSGHGLAASYAWPQTSALDRLAAWPIRVALAAVGALSCLPTIDSGRLGLKWPNDVMVDNAKLGGVLVNRRVAKGQAWLIAGIGLNLDWTADAPPSRRVASIRQISQMLPTPTELMQALNASMAKMLQSLPIDLKQEFSRRDVYAQLPVAILNADHGAVMHQGINQGINDAGELLLDITDANGQVITQTICMGEVSLAPVASVHLS